MGTPRPDLSPQRMRQINARPEVVPRNLQITKSYHDLGVALDAHLGGEDRCWCIFATWASKQAGSFIRKEEVPAALRGVLQPGPDRVFWRRLSPRAALLSQRVLRYARLTTQDVAAHIAEGNRLVHAHLAPLFAALLEMVEAEQRPGPEARQRFLAELAADHTAGPELTQAFTSYFAALAEPDLKLRAERILLANILVGLHEQTRLQEAIAGALRAPVQQAIADPQRRFTELPLPQWLRGALGTLVLALFGPLIRRFEEDVARASTAGFMTLAMPSGTVRLGEDVPPLPDGRQFPEVLEKITLPELAQALARLDARPEELSGSGARDWAALADRMNFIADLFRSRQRELVLRQPPFDDGQAAAIDRGEVPGGPL